MSIYRDVVRGGSGLNGGKQDDKQKESRSLLFHGEWERRREPGGSRRLQQSGRGERERLSLADDDVIQQSHIHTIQRISQPLGEQLVRGRRFRTSRWVLVGDDQSGGVVSQGALNHNPGVHLSGVNRPSEQSFTSDDLML